jgi:hypothetical protein
MEIYDRGLLGLSSLDGAERLIYMLQDFDNLMEMEGWDHFFLHEHYLARYSEMKGWLQQIRAEASLTVLNDYESHVRSMGFEVSPGGVEALLMSRDEAYYRSCPDWCGRYRALRDDRWTKTTEFLRSQGIALQAAEPDARPLGQRLVSLRNRNLIFSSEPCLMFINQVMPDAIPAEVEACPPEFRRELEEYVRSLGIGSPDWEECLLIGGIYAGGVFGDRTTEEVMELYQGIARKNRMTAEALLQYFQRHDAGGKDAEPGATPDRGGM